MTTGRALSLIFVIAIFMFLLNYVKPAYAPYHFGCGFPTCICSEYDDDGNTCYYSYGGCFGVFCLEGCFYMGTDTNKPSCDPYTSGTTCYYGGTAQCTSSGWSCSYSSSCSLCSGTLIGSCTSSGCTNFYKCSSSCGAASNCDGKCRSTLVSSTSYCNSVCQSNNCGGTLNCAQFDDNEANWCMGGGSVGGYTYCTYDGSSWAYRSSYPAENCCDGVDNDCDGYTDIADSDCSGRCCSDSDCSSQNNIKGQCISNVCQWPPCDADSDCTSGLCYCGGSACYSSFTSASCSAGYCCNRGYGGSGIGSCVYQGTTYNNIYLCDP